MILLVMAMYGEAKPFVKALQMKTLKDMAPLQVYEGALGDEPVRLLLTGVGKLRACACVSAYLARCSKDALQGLFLVNVGLAGLQLDSAGADQCDHLGSAGIDPVNHQDIGALYLAQSVRDAGSGRTYYPELPLHPFGEAALLCVDRPVTEGFSGKTCLVDMESAGVCEAAAGYLFWNQTSVLKCVSDFCQGEKPDLSASVKLMEGCCGAVLDWLKTRQRACETAGTKDRAVNQRSKRLRDAFGLAFLTHRMTTAMAYQMEQVLKAFDCLPDEAQSGAVEELQRYSDIPAAPLKWQEKQLFDEVLQRLTDRLDEAMFVAAAGRPSASFNAFRHIYVEEGLSEGLTAPVLEKLPGACPVYIHHFKDVFNRTHQDFQAQKRDTALILAKKTDHFVYPGAPVCQSFGNAHFYYASLAMNCLYDCEYCYLQGMYPGGHMVAFLNLEDYFVAVEALLKEHPVYLCISFDTDLLALEGVLGFGKRWCAFAAKHPDLKVEIRTKGDGGYFLRQMQGADIPANVILAWTLSPEAVIRRFEHRSADLTHRLQGMKAALQMGFQVRACFDPAIWLPDFEAVYGALIRRVFQEIPAEQLTDASIGTFRISQEYLKTMRKNRPGSAIVQRPYQCEGGVAGYGKGVSQRMMGFLKKQLLAFLPEERIFLWEPLE
jgi:spore photoproduct lyase